MNKELYGKSFKIPQHILDTLRKSISQYSNQSVENTKRAQELSETGEASYQQLKRIKNWFDSNSNPSSPDFHVLGGDTLKGWINTTLDSSREEKRLPKEIKSVAMDNRFIKTHTKNDDLRTDFRPKHSHTKHFLGLTEEIEKINNWFNKLIL